MAPEKVGIVKLAREQAGDRVREAVVQQLVALLPRLRRFAHGLTGSSDEGDDVVQSSCERALTRLDQWREGTRLDSWMFRIVQTVWIDRVRRRREVALAPEAWDQLPGTDGVRDAEARAELRAVRRLIGELPDDQRTVLLLVSVEGLSYREAAEVLDLPVGTVMSRLSRARLALGRRLTDQTPRNTPHQEAADGDTVG